MTTFETFGLSKPTNPGDGWRELIGQVIDGRFTLEDFLGEGGFGWVFRARQRAPNRRVAIKVQKRLSDDSNSRMLREADLLASLDHPGIARVYEAGRWQFSNGPRIYVAMELVADARRLDVYCREERLDARQRTEIFRRACDAVRAAHAQGIVHRDLKPGNILVDQRGQPRIIDFGISKPGLTEQDDTAIEILQAGHEPADDGTRTGMFMGTKDYAAPEQRGSHATPRCDVHALGVILEKDLFDAETVLPAGIKAIARRCTHPDPQQRYADAGKLSDAIADQFRRGWLARVAAAVVISGILIVVTVLLLGEPVPPTPPTSTPTSSIASPQSAPQPIPLENATPIDDASFMVAAPSGTVVATIRERGSVALSSLTSDHARLRLPGIGPAVGNLAFDGMGERLAAADANGWVIWNIGTLDSSSRPRRLPVSGASAFALVNPSLALAWDGSRLFGQTGPRSVTALDTDRSVVDGEFTVPGSENASISALAPGARNDLLYVSLSDGAVYAWNLGSNQSSLVQEPQDGAAYLAADGLGRHIAVGRADGSVTIHDGGTGNQVAAHRATRSPITAISFADQRTLLVGAGHELIRFEFNAEADKKSLQVTGTATAKHPISGITSSGTRFLGLTVVDDGVTRVETCRDSAGVSQGVARR